MGDDDYKPLSTPCRPPQALARRGGRGAGLTLAVEEGQRPVGIRRIRERDEEDMRRSRRRRRQWLLLLAPLPRRLLVHVVDLFLLLLLHLLLLIQSKKKTLQVSVLSFGAWVTFGDQVDVLAATKIMQRARDAGVNFFDNAEVYGSGKAEEVAGEALRELGWPRSSFVLSTKIFWGGQGVNDTGLSRKHIVEGLDASLERLGVSYVDVVLAHRPDDETPVEETVRAFNHVIEQGKALYWGTSEWLAAVRSFFLGGAGGGGVFFCFFALFFFFFSTSSTLPSSSLLVSFFVSLRRKGRGERYRGISR